MINIRKRGCNSLTTEIFFPFPPQRWVSVLEGVTLTKETEDERHCGGPPLGGGGVVVVGVVEVVVRTVSRLVYKDEKSGSAKERRSSCTVVSVIDLWATKCHPDS